MSNIQDKGHMENVGVRERIVSYYDETWLDYRVLWINKRNRALHFGYFEEGINNHDEALINMNMVLSKKANILSSDRVLDAGCGQGGSSMWMAEHIGCHVVGITLVPHQVLKAQEHSKSRKLEDRTEFYVKDYCNTGFSDASFSVIWACESICHSPSKEEFYREAYRLLKPGGRLIVAEYIRNSRNFEPDKEKVLNQWCSGWSMPDLDTWAEHESNLINEGFTNIDHQDVTVNMKPSLEKLHRVSKKLLKLGNILHFVRIRNNVKHGNHIASIRQYEALTQKLWYYSIFSASKPEY
ncbi:MAG: methyltransferase domain-containing protein [Saprospiraceae bacterium]|nr:methyltransferase domain-containing protein [Saprospiraceae bacterium]